MHQLHVKFQNFSRDNTLYPCPLGALPQAPGKVTEAGERRLDRKGIKEEGERRGRRAMESINLDMPVVMIVFFYQLFYVQYFSF